MAGLLWRNPISRGFCALLVFLVCRGALDAEQVTGVAARCRAGQTFVTFREVRAAAAARSLSVRQFRESRRTLLEERRIRYRVYRSRRPVVSLEGLEPIGEAPPLSSWNVEYYGDLSSHGDKPALRYVIEDGADPLPPGTGLFVHNPDDAGTAYYAVTVVVGAEEDRSITEGNALREPIDETVGQGVPVLQRIERPDEWQYVRDPTLHYFVRWESPPNCSVEGKPIDYVVAVPPELAEPTGVGIHLHCWGGSLNGGYGWWYRAENGHILVASNQTPYDWWTGYHERYWKTTWERAERDREQFEDGVVRPYSQTRVLSFVDWVATKWDVDLTRTHVAGNSMGGSGAPMLAIRHPERIAWATAWVGVHIPARSPQFSGSYARVWGEESWDVSFEDGTPVWSYFDDAAYVRTHPDIDLGLISFSNGKNDGGIGWPQAVAFYRALQEAHQPHIFVWGQGGHGQRARLPVSLDDRRMPMDLRTNRSLPAFSSSSLDDDPGGGTPGEGDPEGQSNLYLFWETDGGIDAADRWELTVGLVDGAPVTECTADMTPRRCQRFRLRAGEKARWTSTSITGDRTVQSGEAVADRHGLLTLSGVRIQKGKNRVAVTR